ncbi:MAG: DUF2958 domain-containing protein [Planctomycetes bacterium]|nr:DUF2958 domain-containing protein [Planctomycetota bacterium]
MPSLYATDSTPVAEKLIHEHFFLGGSDWYAAEYCPRRRLFFGFVILNGDRANAEWGYFGLDELRAVAILGMHVDRDLHWTARPARDVEAIASCLHPRPAHMVIPDNGYHERAASPDTRIRDPTRE